MAFRAIRVALLISSLPIAGCGTVANLAQPHPEEGGRTPFGGVRRDMQYLEKAANREAGPKTPPPSDSEQCKQVALKVGCAVDLPFSFIGDVVTWPYTVSFTCINQPIYLPPMAPAPPTPPQATQATQATANDGPQVPPPDLPQPRKLP